MCEISEIELCPHITTIWVKFSSASTKSTREYVTFLSLIFRYMKYDIRYVMDYITTLMFPKSLRLNIHQVYQVNSGYSPNKKYLPNSRFLYATGSCKVCVLKSLQKRSSPTFADVALEPVTSNTPDVTRSPVSVVTTLRLATHSANSPRCSAVTPERFCEYVA